MRLEEALAEGHHNIKVAVTPDLTYSATLVTPNGVPAGPLAWGSTPEVAVMKLRTALRDWVWDGKSPMRQLNTATPQFLDCIDVEGLSPDVGDLTPL